ncbi:ABC transporter permease [Clostridium ihumii]|uniref:ABC transporter permease n=1 Tax=Clostridium ihumii TaxID=1470356 RepID=UPI003D348D6F
MLYNNNKEIIKRLVRRSLKANKIRNICAILAIALTTILITVTIEGAIIASKADEKYNIISRYNMDCDGYVSMYNKDKDDLKSITNIKKIGICERVSIKGVKNKELVNEYVNFMVADKTAYDMIGVYPIKGDYPKNADEVLVPTWILEVLNVDKKVGEKIKLDIAIGNNIKPIEFKLCGYYETFLGKGSDKAKIFTHEDFIDKNNIKINKSQNARIAMINLKDVKKNSSFKEVENKIDKIAKELGVEKYQANPKYDKEKFDIGEYVKKVIAVGSAILIIIFTGYLIIYNIFYISVSKDVRFYGLLKTIGTTSKQLKKIVINQALLLCIIAIPIGLFLGYLTTIIMMPIVLSSLTFGNFIVIEPNLYAFLLAIIFSLVTVIISTRKPAKATSKICPIEAVRYVSGDFKASKKKIKKGIGGAKVHKMAWSNIVKNKKRVTLSIFSIALSATTVIATINATMSLNPQKHADSQMGMDIEIENDPIMYTKEQDYKPITEGFINDIKNLDIVKNVKTYYSGITPLEDGKILIFEVEFSFDGLLKKEFKSYGDPEKKHVGYREMKGDRVRTSVNSIKEEDLEEELKNLKVIDGKIDKEKFKTGEYIICYPYPNMGKMGVLKAGDVLPLNFILKDKDGKEVEMKKEFKVMAVVAKNKELSPNNLEIINLEENQFKKIFTNYKECVNKIGIELKDNVDIEKADEIMSKMLVNSENEVLKLRSKSAYIKEMENFKLIIATIGVSISSILGLIGVINVMNTIFTGIFSRQIEFAMLESIGMTKKQLKKMLRFEGWYYTLLSSSLIIPLGIFASIIGGNLTDAHYGMDIRICIISIIIAIVIITAFMLIIPLIGYNLINKENIIDRLKVTE